MAALIGYNTINFSQRWVGKFFRNELPFRKEALPDLADLRAGIAVNFVGTEHSISYNLYRIPRVDKRTTNVLTVENSYGNSLQFTGLLTAATGLTRKFVMRGLKPTTQASEVKAFLAEYGGLPGDVAFDVTFGVVGREHV